eukprot:scaffold71_cov265-Chaetoceros_neogracile.AAC.34
MQQSQAGRRGREIIIQVIPEKLKSKEEGSLSLIRASSLCIVSKKILHREEPDWSSIRMQMQIYWGSHGIDSSAEEYEFQRLRFRPLESWPNDGIYRSQNQYSISIL